MSFQLPDNRAEALGEPSLMVSPHWIEELPRFVRELNALRQAQAEKDKEEP